MCSYMWGNPSSTGFASKAPLRNSSLPSAYRHKTSRWLHSVPQLLHMGVSKNRGGPPKSWILMGFSNINIYKPSILGYQYFWKHPHSTRQDPLATQSRSVLRFGFFACSIADNGFNSPTVRVTPSCHAAAKPRGLRRSMRLLYGTVHNMLIPFLWQEEIAHACETLQRKGL